MARPAAVIPDRIETAGTFLLRAAATPAATSALTGTSTWTPWWTSSWTRSADRRREAPGHESIHLMRASRLKAVSIRTAPLPGLPPTCRPFMAINAVADGTAIIRETIFENRFMHAVELQRLGADIKIDGERGGDEGRGAPAGAAASWPPTCAPPPAW